MTPLCYVSSFGGMGVCFVEWRWGGVFCSGVRIKQSL